MAGYDSQGYLAPAPGFDLDYNYQVQSNNSPLYSASTVSDLTIAGEQQLTPPSYHISPGSNVKQKGKQPAQNKGAGKTPIPMPATDGAADAAVNKPKRVRTGCLTCRERHLKCDEGLPDWYVVCDICCEPY